MLVAPESREEVPEAQSQRIWEAEPRQERREPVGNLFEWLENHVPLERVRKGHGV